MNIVFFEANHDSATSRCHVARQKIRANWPSLNQHRVFGLYGVDATKAALSDQWSKCPGLFNLITAMAHGSPDTFCGQHDHSVLTAAGANATNTPTTGSVVHLYSCDCATTLGPYLVKNGSKAFVGYADPVILPNTHSLMDDFVEITKIIDRSIVDGDNATQTKAKVDRAYQATLAALINNPQTTVDDRAGFEANYAALRGPWSSSSLGSY